ncbi:unnamed protein product [Dibothriocephalus latus]|uniref:Uncharacterized protein n=1 Tax=Dibothriocephalus latus TaxID=60516 RepID=A0A3P6V791_DIBLA|nr:unnamed protein product [Dibothriocephalus latus]
MASTMKSTPVPGSLEAECPGGLDWAWESLGECVVNARDKVSIAFGVLSIVCWFIFGIPQIVTNCMKKIPDQAVSPFLLFFWILGDSLNFTGAFLTNQLFLQVGLRFNVSVWTVYLYTYLRLMHLYI